MKDVLVRSDESKKVVDKTDVAITSYSIEEGAKDKKIEARVKKIETRYIFILIDL